MGKRRFSEADWRKEPWFRALCKAIAACKTEDEIADLLRDIGSLSELQAWSERLEVAKQLSRGLSYREVSKNTGASTTTVTRVARFLKDGEGGFQKYLKTLKEEGTYDRVEEMAQDKKEAALKKYL